MQVAEWVLWELQSRELDSSLLIIDGWLFGVVWWISFRSLHNKYLHKFNREKNHITKVFLKVVHQATPVKLCNFQSPTTCNQFQFINFKFQKYLNPNRLFQITIFAQLCNFYQIPIHRNIQQFSFQKHFVYQQLFELWCFRAANVITAWRKSKFSHRENIFFALLHHNGSKKISSLQLILQWVVLPFLLFHYW